jgi:ferredoxin
MLQALVDEHSDRDIWWLRGARNGAEHAFAAEVQTLLAALPNTRSYVYCSRPRPIDVMGHDFDGAGRLTGSILAALGPPRDAHAYLCGPASFMDEISAGLSDLGIETSHIHTEAFGPAPGLTPGIAASSGRAPHPPVGQAGQGPTIEFARSDLAIRWSDEYASLLELAEACDVPVRWSCRTGVCQTCETTLIAGTVGYSPDPVEPPPDGSVLLCCAQPRADTILDL